MKEREVEIMTKRDLTELVIFAKKTYPQKSLKKWKAFITKHSLDFIRTLVPKSMDF